MAGVREGRGWFLVVKEVGRRGLGGPGGKVGILLQVLWEAAERFQEQGSDMIRFVSRSSPWMP